jgi:hypothetical protein
MLYQWNHPETTTNERLQQPNGSGRFSITRLPGRQVGDQCPINIQGRSVTMYVCVSRDVAH